MSFVPPFRALLRGWPGCICLVRSGHPTFRGLHRTHWDVRVRVRSPCPSFLSILCSANSTAVACPSREAFQHDPPAHPFVRIRFVCVAWSCPRVRKPREGTWCCGRQNATCDAAKQANGSAKTSPRNARGKVQTRRGRTNLENQTVKKTRRERFSRPHFCVFFFFLSFGFQGWADGARKSDRRRENLLCEDGWTEIRGRRSKSGKRDGPRGWIATGFFQIRQEKVRATSEHTRVLVEERNRREVPSLWPINMVSENPFRNAFLDWEWERRDRHPSVILEISAFRIPLFVSTRKREARANPLHVHGNVFLMIPCLRSFHRFTSATKHTRVYTSSSLDPLQLFTTTHLVRALHHLHATHLSMLSHASSKPTRPRILTQERRAVEMGKYIRQVSKFLRTKWSSSIVGWFLVCFPFVRKGFKERGELTGRIKRCRMDPMNEQLCGWNVV